MGFDTPHIILPGPQGVPQLQICLQDGFLHVYLSL